MIEYEEGRFNIVKKITYPWQTMKLFRMSKNNSELWNLFPELLNCFVFVFLFFFFKMRFERPTCYIGRGTFCIQVSCSNNSATSPTESLLTSNYTTPKIAIFF